MLARTLAGCLAGAVSLASIAGAQSFNVDIGRIGYSWEEGVLTPSSSYGAAAAQPGFWNEVGTDATPTSPLNDLNGVATGVTLTRSMIGSVDSRPTFSTTGDCESLLDDAQVAMAPLTYTFSNLAAGNYIIYTYAIDNYDYDNHPTVTMNNASGMVQQSVGGQYAYVNELAPGLTHAMHAFSLNSPGNVTITVSPGQTGTAVCSGFQVVALGRGQLRVYVDDSAAGLNLGTSWTDAFTSLQTALEAARRTGGGAVEIWTAQGFYYTTTGSDRTVSFVIPSGLHLYGGFQGTETSLSQRTSPAFYITAMTGSLAGADSFTVVNADNTSSATLVDGFSIAHGDNDGTGGSTGMGGGVTLNNGSAEFRNCKFISNVAGTAGGGVYSSGGAPLFANCLFYHNSCDNGEGAGFYHTGAAKAQLYNCSFLGNTAIGDGGAAKFSFAPGLMANCLFSGNTTSSGVSRGGACSVAGAPATVSFRNCTFSNNHSGGEGGGVATSAGPVDLTNCILWGNTAAAGGSLYDQQARVVTAGAGITVNYSTIQGAAGADGQNPLFVNAVGADGIVGTSDDDCRLQAGSPSIDAGNEYLMAYDVPDLDNDGNTNEYTPIDLDGKPRFVDDPATPNTGAGILPMSDRGAYEFQPPCNLAGDLNGDKKVDLSDLATLLGNYGLTSGATHAQGDLTGDGAVNLNDLAQLLSQYGATCP